tara:strand:+ start:458 stop:622 length:165 start_codon:yes stop_codon:yes gene_type:complete
LIYSELSETTERIKDGNPRKQLSDCEEPWAWKKIRIKKDLGIIENDIGGKGEVA